MYMRTSLKSQMNEDFEKSGWRTAINAMECCCGMIANDTKWRKAGNPIKKKKNGETARSKCRGMIANDIKWRRAGKPAKKGPRGNREKCHGVMLRNDRKRYQLAEGKGAPKKKENKNRNRKNKGKNEKRVRERKCGDVRVGDPCLITIII